MRVGDDVVLVAAPLEERHLAEEVAFVELGRAPGHDAHGGLAAADEIHRPAWIAGGDDGGASLEQPRVEQLGDLGNFRGVEGGEQRHARDHAPRHHEFMPRRFLAEAGREDGDRQREHAEAEQHHHAAEHLAPRRDWDDVAITDGGERGEAPPRRRRDRAEFVGLRVALEEIDDRGREQEQHHHHQQGAEQRAIFIGEHPLHGLERRRVAQQLEQPEQAEQAQGAEIDREDRIEIPGRESEQVDDHHRP